MKKNIKKLKLNKLAIAKLTNIIDIKGGSTACGPGPQQMSKDYLCPSEGQLCESVFPWNTCPPRVNEGGPGTI